MALPWKANLPSNDEEIVAYVAGYHKNVKWVQVCYDHLSVLDAKANGLLRYNSIMVAVWGLIFNAAARMIGDQFSALINAGIAFAAATLMSTLLSMILCMNIIRLFWFNVNDLNQLQIMQQEVDTVRQAAKDQAEVKRIASAIWDVVARRTRQYRIAWGASLCSTIAFFLMIFFLLGRLARWW